MSRAALTHNGVVENIILAAPDFDTGAEFTLVPIGDTPVYIGDLYDGTEFTKPVENIPVPASVTPLQMRKALRAIGLKSAVDAFVAAMDNEEALEEWEYAISIERHNPMLSTAAAQLGMSVEQLDDLFRLAATMA